MLTEELNTSSFYCLLNLYDVSKCWNIDLLITSTTNLKCSITEDPSEECIPNVNSFDSI